MLEKNKKYIVEYEPTPTLKNIEYVFQRLILAVLEAANYKLYKKSHEEYKQIFSIIIKWLSIFINQNDLLKIDLNEFNMVKKSLFNLDSTYISVDGLYAEDAYEWILQLEIILEKLRRNNNGV